MANIPVWMVKKHSDLLLEKKVLLDVIDSLYQIIQRGELTSFDMKQADEVYDSVKQYRKESEDT
jgi:hypothetical protein